MNRIVILLIICVLCFSCVNNRLTHQAYIKGSYIVVEKNKSVSPRIVGFVKDMKTNQVLPFANVSVEGMKEVGTRSNEQGFFSLEVDPGKIQIKVSSVGNTVLKTKSLRIKPKEMLVIHFYLGTFEIN
ncbi:MAG: carboxypeptidase-like regulatory domain-containing protein [Bacteroidales bacterium]|nr:carboxypeptidase-like regulatory domain-containing protein [Bacteroidales bacterium]